jgi:hypothetical protein
MALSNSSLRLRSRRVVQPHDTHERQPLLDLVPLNLSILRPRPTLLRQCEDPESLLGERLDILE